IGLPDESCMQCTALASLIAVEPAIAVLVYAQAASITDSNAREGQFRAGLRGLHEVLPAQQRVALAVGLQTPRADVDEAAPLAAIYPLDHQIAVASIGLRHQ